ncbi:hypothetical protein IDH21_02025 [Pelagibacterales bacterium SAG-MED47]|nr:hypothetical protein [Pelagibacterales bacterium SAG-MED47]
MKKLFFILLFTFFITEKGYTASDEGQPTQYEVTMKKVELCTDLACTSPYVLGEKIMAADIAPDSGGADVGNYAPTTGIPPGIVYTHLRVTISRTFTVTASISVDGGLCRTDGGNNANATQMTVGASSGTAVAETMYLVNAGSYGASDGTRDGAVGSSNIDVDYSSPDPAKSMTVSGDDAVMVYELTAPYQKTLRAPVIKVKFSTVTAVGVEDTACSMYLNEPSVTISLQ